jgi:hypothetical protein
MTGGNIFSLLPLALPTPITVPVPTLGDFIGVVLKTIIVTPADLE